MSSIRKRNPLPKSFPYSSNSKFIFPRHSREKIVISRHFVDVKLSFMRCQQNERQIPIFNMQISWKISSTSLRNSNINIKKNIFSHICYSKQNFVTSPPHTTKFRLNKNMPNYILFHVNCDFSADCLLFFSPKILENYFFLSM